MTVNVLHTLPVGVSGIISKNSQGYFSINAVKPQDLKTSGSPSMHFSTETILTWKKNWTF